MKRLLKSISGVTLLEIMLVLAIAAMVIVMSVRYYQSAGSAAQANTVLAQLQAISAAAENLAQATGDYTAAGVNNTTVAPLLPANGLATPWGTTITVVATGSNTWTATVPSTPASQCGLIRAKITANSRFTAPACGTTTTNLVITYNSQTT
jgi:type II secretory pathway pseudopilin PulG